MAKTIRIKSSLFLYLGVIMYMYLTNTVAYKLGVSQVGTVSSLLLVFLTANTFMTKGLGKLIPKFRIEFFVIAVATFILFFQLILNNTIVIKGIIFIFIVPVAISIMLSLQSNKIKYKIMKLILIFFIVECFLAIYERVFVVNIFSIEQDSFELIDMTIGFRSTALLGHPLANALCVSTIMGFVSVSTLKLGYKNFFIGIGFLALLSFNSRGIILLWAVLGAGYIAHYLIMSKQKYKLLLLLPLVGWCLKLVIDYGFGDRLFISNLFDGSAMTRFEVFNAFSFVNNYDFWLGNGGSYKEAMYKLGAGGIENPYIVMMLNYGVPLAIILVVALFVWIKKTIEPFDNKGQFIIISSFVIAGSMNNSLASSSAWVFFVLCSRSFIPLSKEHLTINNVNIDIK